MTIGTHERLFPAASQGSPLNAPVDLHPALNEVRRMPEFQPKSPGWLDELLKQPWARQLSERASHFMDQVLEGINRFLSHIRPPGVSNLPENIRDLFSGFIAFLFVLMLLYAFYLLLGSLLQLRESRRTEVLPAPRKVGESLLVSSGHHAGNAAKLAKDGRYEAALRELYLSLLCLLDESRLVPFERARSNREYLEHLQHQDRGIGQDFQKLARQFEASRYGRQPMTAERYAACQAAYEQLKRWSEGRAHAS